MLDQLLETLQQIPAGGGDVWQQYGALALVGAVIIYVTAKLVNWLTSTLDDKLDALTRAVETAAASTRDLADEVRKLRDEVTRLRGDIERDRRHRQ